MPRFRYSVLLTVVFLLLWLSFTQSLLERPAVAAAEPAPGRMVERGQRLEREKRFLMRALDDLRNERKMTEEDIGELEKQIDAITPLESARRTDDFQELLDWHYGYLDWLGEQSAEFEADLAQLSSTAPSGGEPWERRYAGMAKKEKELVKELGGKVKRFSAEEKRLARILDRRLILRARFFDLEEQLARIDKKLADQQRPLSDKEKETAKRLRVDVRVVQTELLSLPEVDEDILKHYAVMIERGRWKSDWLELQIDEYEALRAVAAVISLDAGRNSAAMEAAYQRIIRSYESGINRLNRKIDELARKESRVSPAGSLRQMDRSRELLDFYGGLRIKYDDRIRRLKTRIGAYEAELAEVLSAKP
jgi:hypothetical protein